MKLIVAGAGIGGLTCALAFARLGWDVDIIERSPALGEIGAGIQLSPNATRLLQALGLGAQLHDIGFAPSALELYQGKSGQQIFSIKAGTAAEERWGAAYLHVHRADLISMLEKAVRSESKVRVHLSSELVGLSQIPGSVSAELSTGDTLQADLLVGADGIHSAVRRCLFGPDTPDFTGCLAWRTTVPIAKLGALAPPPTARVWVGPRKHAVTYRLRSGTLANFVGVVERTDLSSESWNTLGKREEALADFEGWHPILTNLLETCADIYLWALYDRAPMPSWSQGRATLLGDACHAVLPFMAQGAAMAIEDAYILAQLCHRGKRNLETALQRHYELRSPRTKAIRTASRANKDRFHKRAVVDQATTYAPMKIAGILFPSIVAKQQDWIYRYDAVGVVNASTA
ncbi:MAG: FAD-dependent monooxygenase [Pseudomonadota bacterium]